MTRDRPRRIVTVRLWRLSSRSRSRYYRYSYVKVILLVWWVGGWDGRYNPPPPHISPSQPRCLEVWGFKSNNQDSCKVLYFLRNFDINFIFCRKEMFHHMKEACRKRLFWTFSFITVFLVLRVCGRCFQVKYYIISYLTWFWC